jgi:hypothetical protein
MSTANRQRQSCHGGEEQRMSARLTVAGWLAAALVVTIPFAGCGAANNQTSTPAVSSANKAKSHADVAAERVAQARQAARKKAQAAKLAVESRAAARQQHHEDEEKRQEEAAGHGLGATKATFEANNTMQSQEGTEPPEGTDYYRITETGPRGRVMGYEVTIYATPPFSNQERIGLLGGVDLPNGTEPLPSLEHSDCYVWRSPALERLIGKEYAEGTTEDETDSARMEAVSTPRC